MQRIRFAPRPDARGAVQVEDLPSGRLQFRSADAAAAPQPEPPVVDGVEDYVADSLRAATEQGEAAGALDFKALEQEFEENGRLSEESFDLLEAAGVPRWVVERYIDGMAAIGDRLLKEAHDIAGGEQRFRAAQIWAESNLSGEELDAYHEAIQSTPARARFAIQGLCAAHQRATGAPPRLTRGDAGSISRGAFTSAQEVADAIRDPRYKKDAAYRAQIAARLAKSRVF